jgi:DNA modification methylase
MAKADFLDVHCSHNAIEPVGNLKPHPRNPNRHSDEQVELLARIIKAQGWRKPITVSKRSGFITSGHARLMAAKKMLVTHVPVDYQEYVNEEVELADLLADNRIAELADIDGDAVGSMMQELMKSSLDLDLTGYDATARALMNEVEGTSEKALDDAVKPEIAAGKEFGTGEMWALGNHRLICGDAKNPDIWAALMDGAQANLIFTDPPYGISYESTTDKFAKIQNDEKTGDRLIVDLLKPVFQQAMLHASDDAAWYVWHATTTRDEFSYALKAAGIMERQYIIWAKPSFVLGWSDYRWAHEPCFYAAKEGQKPRYFGQRNESTVWRLGYKTKTGQSMTLGHGINVQDGQGSTIFIGPGPTPKKVRNVRLAQGEALILASSKGEDDLWEVSRESDYEHPTQKPVELARRALQNSSLPGEIVIDPFLGSGTTLLGAESTGRKCYGIELDRAYCDVILQRFEKLTGVKPQKL